MLRPDGVYQSAVVSFTAPPPGDGNTFCALPFPYVVRAEQQRAVVILQRAGDDLRRARRKAVDQHGDREASARLRRAVGERARRIRACGRACSRSLARIEKEIGHRDALIEQSARVAAQIEDRAIHPDPTQRIDRTPQIGRRLLAEDVRST